VAAAVSVKPVAAQEELLQELKQISSLRIEGRRQVAAGRLKAVMKTRAPASWPRRWLPWRRTPVLRFDYLRSDTAAIAQLYRRYGFLDTQVDYQVASGSGTDDVAVTFHIFEGSRSRVHSVALPGVTAFESHDLERRLWSRQGRPFDPAYLHLDTLRIAALYQEKGYFPHASGAYRRDPADSLKIDVRYQVDEGDRFRFGNSTIQTAGVKEQLVRRELVLPPGAIYQRSRVQRSQERLYQTGLFSQVQIEPRPDSVLATMEFDVRVVPRRPRWVDAAVGSGTEERFRFSGEWGHRNIWGTGFQAIAGSQVSLYNDGRFQRWHTEVSVLEPWFLRTRTRFQVTPYYERYDDRAQAQWVTHQDFRALNFQLRRELNRFTRVSVTQENMFAHQDFEPLQSIADSTLDSLSQVVKDYTTHRVVLSFDRDLRDNPFNPVRGSAIVTAAEIAGGAVLKGTSSFHKAHIYASWYTPARVGWTIASRVGAGIVNPFGPRPAFSAGGTVDEEVARVPLEDRFRLGGVNSIRAHDENSIPPNGAGGLATLLGNVELRIATPVRIPFLGMLGVEAYADVGNVWARPEYVLLEHFTQTDDSDPNSVRYVVGVGPRVDLPVGPLRFDVSWRVRPTTWKPKVQFAIGPSF